MKQLVLPVVILLSIVLAGCSEQMQTEEIYDRAITATEELESVTFQRNQTLRAQQESFRSAMNGVIQYEPLEVYSDVQMHLLNLNESVDMDMLITEDEWKVRPYQPGAMWQERNREDMTDPLFDDPTSLLKEFEPYKESFLMKQSNIRYYEPGQQETDEVDEEELIPTYEISFRGADEQYKPLVQKHIEQMGLASHENVNIEEVMDSVEIERIDMTIFIDQETFDVHRFQTRFRYVVQILDEYRVIDESLLVRFQDHNQPITIDEFVNQD